ncbi:tetratricopeptide repeat protein [Planctomycetota bacterium]
MDRDEEAVEAYRQAIAIAPDYTTANFHLGLSLGILERYEEAIAAFKRAIKADPGFSFQYYGLGLVYDESGRYEEAIEAFNQAIGIDPRFAEAYCQLGSTYCKLGHQDDAIRFQKKAIEINPDDGSLHNYLGVTYSRFGLYEDSVNAYRSAVAIDPNAYIGYNNLAWLCATCPDSQFRDGTKALELAKKACELTDIEDAHCLTSLAAAYAECGDFEKAIEYQEKGIKLIGEEVTEEWENSLEAYKSGKLYRSHPALPIKQ